MVGHSPEDKRISRFFPVMTDGAKCRYLPETIVGPQPLSPGQNPHPLSPNPSETEPLLRATGYESGFMEGLANSCPNGRKVYLPFNYNGQE